MKSIAAIIAILFLPVCGFAFADDDYYVYVDELPDYAEFAVNVLYESTLYWEEQIPGLHFYLVDDPTDANFRVQWVKEFGVEHVGYAFGNKFIEVGLGDSNCIDSWTPFSANHVSNIVKHEIGHILGFDHSTDKNDIMYPVALSHEYGLVKNDYPFVENYGYFVPFCTSKPVTSFDYEISTDDPVYGFDVYFVPSADSLQKFGDNEPFEYYADESCYGKNYLSYGGTCESVSGDGGIMIFTHDTLSNPLTTITLQYEEHSLNEPLPDRKVVFSKPSKPNAPDDASPVPVPVPPEPVPDDPAPAPVPPELPSDDDPLVPVPVPPESVPAEIISSTDVGSIKLDSGTFQIAYSDTVYVKVSGTIYDKQSVDKVAITWTYPDGLTNGNIVFITDQGYFESLLILDGKSPIGTYEVLASSRQKIVGLLTFDVVEKTSSQDPIISKPVETTSVPNLLVSGKDPSHYIDRYNNESGYKDWFDANYPDYSIYELVGLKDPTSFVDADKDPPYYINRYNNEPEYKDWFDANYPGYSIYDVVGLKDPTSFVDADKDPRYYINRYNNEPEYKDWFDANYPDYSIYELVGLKDPTSFVDADKDPQYYIDRYNNEPEYKDWFDANYPDYSIYELVGLKDPTSFVDADKDPQYYIDRYNNEPEYKDWFDTNYPGYSIYDVVGLKDPTSFVDADKDPQYYINRYNNEPEYKDWFDTNYPGYSIYDVVGIDAPQSITWIKQNAKMWSDGEISDETFVSDISYLISNDVIVISEPTASSFSSESSIPSWLKYNVSLWHDEKINDATFLELVKYLVEHGVIVR